HFQQKLVRENRYVGLLQTGSGKYIDNLIRRDGARNKLADCVVERVRRVLWVSRSRLEQFHCAFQFDTNYSLAVSTSSPSSGIPKSGNESTSRTVSRLTVMT